MKRFLWSGDLRGSCPCLAGTLLSTQGEAGSLPQSMHVRAGSIWPCGDARSMAVRSLGQRCPGSNGCPDRFAPSPAQTLQHSDQRCGDAPPGEARLPFFPGLQLPDDLWPGLRRGLRSTKERDKDPLHPTRQERNRTIVCAILPVVN